ncbi:MAG: hypothetical protein HY882_07185 [Deltaproteobacteria bacterium]|nr:hypothetical protein [Deltaproteobacteria bacterium]
MRSPESGGLAGKILRVDLGRKKISTEETEKYARNFLGGRTLNSFLLFNEMDPETKFSDPSRADEDWSQGSQSGEGPQHSPCRI